LNFTKFYIGILYLVVIISTIIFYLNNHYIVASLLFFGNLLPGYKLWISLSETDEN